jgi:hypothetical protein
VTLFAETRAETLTAAHRQWIIDAALDFAAAAVLVQHADNGSLGAAVCRRDDAFHGLLVATGWHRESGCDCGAHDWVSEETVAPREEFL